MDSQFQPKKSNLLISILKLPFHLVRSLRSLIITLMILVQLGLVLIVILLIFRPPSVWTPFKKYLNSNYEPRVYLENSDEIYQEINAVQGREELSLDETQLSVLISEKYNAFSAADALISDHQLTLYFNIEEEKKAPLWIKVILKENGDHSLNIDSIGFIRFNVPESLIKLVNKYFIKINDLIHQKSLKDLLIEILNQDKFDKNVFITDSWFEENRLILNVEKQ
ncbi:MAG: hypothetical protein WCJ58_04225 [bacterium]